jgi:hypothetical protein
MLSLKSIHSLAGLPAEYQGGELRFVACFTLTDGNGDARQVPTMECHAAVLDSYEAFRLAALQCTGQVYYHYESESHPDNADAYWRKHVRELLLASLTATAEQATADILGSEAPKAQE